MKLHPVKTLNGRSLKIHVSRGTVTIGGARIIETNIAASNGVIHVINQVLTPALTTPRSRLGAPTALGPVGRSPAKGTDDHAQR